MSRISCRVWILCVVFALAPTEGRSWGTEGHQIVADMAEALLTPAARLKVASLLGGARMRDVANYADEILPVRPDTRRWHYVAPMDDHIDPKRRDCQLVEGEGDCVIFAIHRALDTIGNRNYTDEQRALELKYLIHFVADAHQPFNAVADRRQGKDIRVRFLGESTNLHQVWDSGLIRRKGVAVADYAARLVQRWNAVRDPAGMKAWGVAVDWTAESHRLAQNTILPEGAEIDEAWVDTFLPVMEERLMLAGVRLGGVISQRLR